jgi:hypothetical protein
MKQGTTFKEFKQLLFTDERLKNICKSMNYKPTKDEE